MSHVPKGPCASRRCVSAGLALCLSVGGAAQGQSAGPSTQALADMGFVRPDSWTVVPDHASGIITGTVLTGPDTLAPGVAVTLAPATGTARNTISDADGHFTFADVPPGTFTVKVTLPGFEIGSASATLQAGQRFVLEPLVLKLAMVNISVNAVASQEQLAQEQLHTEEKQRLLGVLPNFFISYTWNAPPMTTRQKYALAWKSTIDPGNLLLVGTTAGIQQADNAFPGYHQGAAGYGRRYGADLGNLVAGTFMGGAVLPSLFHQDPRYFYKGTGTVKSRFLYALSTAVICRGDNGRRQPAWASVLGDLSAGAISNIYYPASDRQGAGLTFENGFLGVAGDAMNNLVQEFVLHKLTTKGDVKKATNP